MAFSAGVALASRPTAAIARTSRRATSSARATGMLEKHRRIAQRHVRVRLGPVEIQGAACGSPPRFERLSRLRTVVLGGRDVRATERRMGGGESGIECQGLLEVGDRLRHTVRARPVPVIPAFQVRLMSVAVAGADAAFTLRPWAQLEREGNEGGRFQDDAAERASRWHLVTRYGSTGCLATNSGVETRREG